MRIHREFLSRILCGNSLSAPNVFPATQTASSGLSHRGNPGASFARIDQPRVCLPARTSFAIREGASNKDDKGKMRFLYG